jgi:hypothetical protein
MDDEAILDTDNAAYVAGDDIADACLKPEAYYEGPPRVITTREVNYVPASYVYDNASLSGSGTTYLVADEPAPSVTYLPVTFGDDSDADTIYLSDSDAGDSCSCPVALNTLDNDVDLGAVRYVPTTEVENMNAGYIDSSPADNVSYVPDEDMNVDTVSSVPVDETASDLTGVVPAEGVGHFEEADVAVDGNPTFTATEVTEPAAVPDDSAVLTTETDSDAVAAMTSTEKIGGDSGYRDGFDAGKATALRMEQFHPADSVDFQNGTTGYEDTYGDIDVYRNAYRSSYLQGYSEGFNSVVGAG